MLDERVTLVQPKRRRRGWNSGWHKGCPIKFWQMPTRPAVYVIYIDGAPVYVGQTTRLRTRIEQHKFDWGYDAKLKTPWGDFPKDSTIHCKYRLSRRAGDWLMWELRLIWKLQPRFNIKSRVRAAA